jgi:mycothiol maleylpyruvate isomerase-like protein
VNPVDVLRYGQRTIDGLIAQLRSDDWTAIALGVWTTKDLVGHLGAFEVRFADVLAVDLGESPESNLLRDDYTTFNDVQAAIRHDWSVAEVVDEYRAAYDRVMRLATRVPDDRWRLVGTIPWYGPEYALDDLLVYSMYGHKREHAPQLEAVLDRPDR